MFDFLNKFGLPLKYAIIGAVGAVIGIALAGLLGMNIALSYIGAAVAGSVGGGIGGWMRQRKGKTD